MLKSGRVGSLQAAANRTIAAMHFEYLTAGTCCVALLVISVAQRDCEVARATRRVRRQIDESGDLLTAEVADFWINARIIGPRDEVASTELDPR